MRLFIYFQANNGMGQLRSMEESDTARSGQIVFICAVLFRSVHALMFVTTLMTLVEPLISKHYYQHCQAWVIAHGRWPLTRSKILLG